MLFDADVLIWLLRRNPNAIETIDRTNDRALSVVTFMDLLQGARDKQEVRAIKDLLADEGFRMMPLSENIGHRAAIYIEEFGLRTRLSVSDALLAATAVENQLPLCTANQRHFKVIPVLQLKPFHP